MDADIGGMGKREEDRGDVDEKVFVVQVDADGDRSGVPGDGGGGASGDAEADLGVKAGV